MPPASASYNNNPLALNFARFAHKISGCSGRKVFVCSGREVCVPACNQVSVSAASVSFPPGSSARRRASRPIFKKMKNPPHIFLQFSNRSPHLSYYNYHQNKSK
ncbi:hypothetical protein [Methanimicrococcus hongohii]|uniref:hypothetical protein n=1 Tax=Methanimicrococcus hongohii TaxID=3028295 RepID=UPI00292CC923|nr:hypothetical protein [Methanimicrococcus sp. Hf6]